MMQITVNNGIVHKITDCPLTLEDMQRIKMASLSPVSNGYIDFIRDGRNVIGWTEKYNPSPVHQKGTAELFQLFCTHNAYLSWHGWVDLDPNPRNFFVDTNQTCDKGGLIPIKDMDITMICKFFVGMALYYPTSLIEKTMYLLAPALNTRDAKLISKAFTLTREKLNGCTDDLPDI